MEECWCPRVSGIFLSSHQAKCTCIHVYRHEYLFWMVAPASENSHIHSVVYWDTYLHFPWEVGGWGPLKAQPCLVWTSSPVLMTPDPEHILWSGRSTVLRRARDLLMKNLLTWQGARTRTDFRLSDGDTASVLFHLFNVVLTHYVWSADYSSTGRVRVWCLHGCPLCWSGEALHWWKNWHVLCLFALWLCPDSEAGSSEGHGPQKPHWTCVAASQPSGYNNIGEKNISKMFFPNLIFHFFMSSCIYKLNLTKHSEKVKSLFDWTALS